VKNTINSDVLSLHAVQPNNAIFYALIDLIQI